MSGFFIETGQLVNKGMEDLSISFSRKYFNGVLRVFYKVLVGLSDIKCESGYQTFVNLVNIA